MELLPYLLTGAISGLMVGLNTGFIYWPAVFMVALASVPMAPVGARLAHYLPRKTLQRVFAVVLALVGMKMVLGA